MSVFCGWVFNDDTGEKLKIAYLIVQKLFSKILHTFRLCIKVENVYLGPFSKWNYETMCCKSICIFFVQVINYVNLSIYIWFCSTVHNFLI